METSANFVDYLVLCAGIVMSLAAGAYYAYKDRKQVSQYRFHRAGGKLKVLPATLSLIVTFVSSISFLGYPTEVYVHGYTIWTSSIGDILAYSSMLWLTIPLFYPLQITSVFEYLQMRHETVYVRRITMTLRTVSMTMYSGIIVYGAALALETVTGTQSWIFIISIPVVAIIYTSIGGLQAVVVADVIQAAVMIGVVIAVLIYGTLKLGGVSNVIRLNKPSGRLALVDFDPNPMTRHTFWSLVIGYFFQSLGMAWHPSSVQRLNSVRTIEEAKKVAWFSLPLFGILKFLFMAEGLVAYAYFADKECDPLASGVILNSNEIIPYTIMDMFGEFPGMMGFFLAGLCSASLSTISSMLGTISAIVSQDFIKTSCVTMPDRMLTLLSKIIVVAFGVVLILVGVGISYIKGPMTQIAGSITGALSGPIMAIFLLSIFIRSTTRTGIYACSIVGFLFAVWLTVGYNFSPGRKTTPWLPLGPTDNCNTTTFSFQDMGESVYNTTSSVCNMTQIPTCMNTTPGNATTLPTNTGVYENNEIYGLDYLYSISYCYHQLLVTIVAMTVGIIVSTLAKDRPAKVPEHLIMRLDKTFFTCQPRLAVHDTENDVSIPIKQTDADNII